MGAQGQQLNTEVTSFNNNEARNLVSRSIGEEDTSVARSISPVPVSQPKRARMNSMTQNRSVSSATSNDQDFYKMMSDIFTKAVSAPQQPTIPSTTQLLADYNVAKAMLHEALAANDTVSENIARSAIERIQRDLNAPSLTTFSG